MAPEVIQNLEVQDEKVDIFSLGVALFVMYFKGYPFEDKKCAHENEKFYRFIHSREYEKFWLEEGKYHRVNHKVPLEFLELITAMLLPDPEKRYSIA